MYQIGMTLHTLMLETNVIIASSSKGNADDSLYYNYIVSINGGSITLEEVTTTQTHKAYLTDF